MTSTDTRACLLRQLDTAWKLTSFHLDGLATEECLWRPAQKGMHVHPTPDGRWRADWPERESYDIGPPSIAWLTWHIGFWWSTVYDRSFGAGRLEREDIVWPGSAQAVRTWLDGLHGAWRAALEQLPQGEFASCERTRWPFTDRPFADVAAWVNLELTKNASEIGYARFLYAIREQGVKADRA